MRGRTHSRRAGERGAILLQTFLFLFVSLGLGVLAVDFGMMVTAQTQLQTVADASSLAAVKELPFGREDGVASRAATYAERNRLLGEPAVLDPAQDLQIGFWDFPTNTFRHETFTPNAVRVMARANEERGNAVETWFFKVFDVETVNVGAAATAVAINRDIVVVIDRSGSMGEQGPCVVEPVPLMPFASEATQSFVRTLSRSTLPDRVGIVSFAHRARIEAPMDDLESRISTLLEAAAGLEAEPCGCSGGTNTGEGLETALEVFERAGQPASGVAQRTIVLVTDGIANRAQGQTSCTEVPPIEGIRYALDVAEQAADRGIVIHSVALGESQQSIEMRIQLQALALATGGQFFFAPRPQQLENLLESLAREVHVALVE